MRYALSTVFLVATILCLAIGWWVERTRKPEPEILYLHLYSNRYDIHSMRSKLPPFPRARQCIASISVSPGVKFFVQLPNHYEPEMQITGTIRWSGTDLHTDFSIDIQDVGTAFTHEQNAPVQLNSVHAFGDNELHFLISDSPDLPSLGLDGSPQTAEQ